MSALEQENPADEFLEKPQAYFIGKVIRKDLIKKIREDVDFSFVCTKKPRAGKSRGGANIAVAKIIRAQQCQWSRPLRDSHYNTCCSPVF